MEVLKIYATPGKPIALGHLGTIVAEPPNSHGEIPITFTVSRRLLKRELRHRHRKTVDKPPFREDTH